MLLTTNYSFPINLVGNHYKETLTLHIFRIIKVGETAWGHCVNWVLHYLTIFTFFIFYRNIIFGAQVGLR